MPPILKFLRLPGSSSDKDLEIIDKSIQFAESNQIDVVTINDTDEVKRLIADSTTVDQSIYVCMPFEGKIFEKLKEKGYRIIGPQCVISCLLLEIPVPKRTYPVCNVAMLDTVVCCSSMKKEERTNIQQFVLMMGGEVTGDFTLSVTHLVAKEVGSKKYEVACSNNIPTVSPTWIHSAWEKSRYDHFVATESNVVKEYIIPIFKGCTICVTGIDATKREAIKTIVQKNGGVYSGELNMKTCTHLLVEHPHGQKYNHARQWKLHCVSPTWLYDCLKKKHWISEKQYKVEPDSDTTVNKSILQQSNIQNTILVPDSSRLSSVTLGKSKNTEKKNTDLKSKNSKLKYKAVLPQSIDISDVKLSENKCYLEECKIYITNHPGPIFDMCKKIINNGAGIRSNVLNESVTHIVTWDPIQPDLSTFLDGIKENDGMFPHVVSPMWLIDCCKNGNMLLEESYSVVENCGSDRTIDDDVFAKPKVPVTKPKQSSTLHMQFEDDIADENTLLDQYLTVNHESTRISQIDMIEDRKEKPNLDEVTQEDDTTVQLDSSLLERKKFAIHRCDTSHVDQITNLIIEYGGEVVDDVENVDYIIVPVSHNVQIPYNEKEVTLCWLEQSIELQKLQDPKSCFLFQPIYLPDEAKPLQNCVITISQYTGIERQHLFHLAELLGGISQEYFVRNDTATMKASTHLILSKPEGSKYDASIKWNIPCVGKEWLFRCAKTRRRLPESAFSMLKNLQNVDTVVIDDDDASEEKEKDQPQLILTVEDTNAHAWEKKEKNNPPDMTIEETNAHAWEKKEEAPIVNEKSIIAPAPNDLSDHISLDFSTRGASLMESTSSNQVITQVEKPKSDEASAPKIGDDISTPFMPDVVPEGNSETTEKLDSPANEPGENNKCDSLESPANDFSAFNAFIAKEKRESLANAKEKDTSPKFPSSLPQDINRSRFSFDFSDALDGFQSPMMSSQDSRRKSRRSRVSLPLDIQFTEALQKAVDKHCADEDVFKNFHDKATDKEEPEEDAILKGVVIVVSKKLLHSQSELHKLTTILGGEIRYLFDDTCTHFIHQGKLNDNTKDFMEAKKKKKYLVSPHWLRACIEANSRVNEDCYPVTFNPRMSIDVTSPRPLRSKGQEKLTSGGSPDDVDVDGKNNRKTNTVELPSPKQVAEVQKKMEEIMNAAKAPKNERRTRRQTTNTSSNKIDNSCNRKMRNRSCSQKNDSAPSSNSDPQIAKVNGVDLINEQSQGGFITYDDPTGRLERERILEHLKRASPSQDIESLYYPVEKLASSVNGLETSEKNKGADSSESDYNDNIQQIPEEPKKSLSPYKPQISLPITNASPKPEVIDLLYDKEAEDELKKIENAKRYKFIFSGMNAQEKIDYGATIEELGGVLFDAQYFNLQSTHLIVKAPTKNEKYLASLACGHWALHKSFLDASRESNDFVDELDHEWGSQADANELALAARRWRIELGEKRASDPNAGAFVGWVVLLCIESSKQAGFKRILEAGGAKLLALRPPFDNIQGATHAFIGDRKQLAKTKVDLRVLHEAGIWILKPEYIADYLIIHPKPPTFDYVLEDVNAFEEQPEITTTQRKRKATEAPRVQKKSKR